MRRSLFILLTLSLTTFAIVAQEEPTISEERYYCTQYGPFFIRFDADKAAGVFAIFNNGDLGSMVGVLKGHSLEGEWIEATSRGVIRMTFSEDWSKFDAQYNVATNPEKWYSNWKGHLRPAHDVTTFTKDGIEFRCRE
jgi:hypothetical protein